MPSSPPATSSPGQDSWAWLAKATPAVGAKTTAPWRKGAPKEYRMQIVGEE